MSKIGLAEPLKKPGGIAGTRRHKKTDPKAGPSKYL